MEVPRLADLDGLGVDVEPSAEPGVIAVTAAANDGAVVTLTWDEMAASVSVRRVEAGVERMSLDRERASRVSVHRDAGQDELSVWFDGDGIAGRLVVLVGERVRVLDTLLRT
jgi:hypothetical protein